MNTQTIWYCCGALAVGALLAASSQAALSRYAVRVTGITEFNAGSPVIEFTEVVLTNQSGTVLIDNDGGSGSPILIKWLGETGSSAGQTFDLGNLSGFLWLKQSTQDRMENPDTGTGDVGASIEWGDVAGWSVVGGSFCHSVPATICDVATLVDSETVPPPLRSTHFDIGAWEFHATGFRGDPYIIATAPGVFGNAHSIPRGVNANNAVVPVLPVVGLAAVGLSVAAMGIASLRQRR